MQRFGCSQRQALRTASHAYHEARRMFIKLYGLASPDSMPRHGSQSRPPTTEELRELLRQNPEMAAAVAKLLEGLMPEPAPSSAADSM